MPELPIKPKKEFSFIRLPRRGQLERSQLLDNFDGVPQPNDGDVLFYKLLRSPSDDLPEGRESGDTVEVMGANEYQTEVNRIANHAVEMSQQPPVTPPTGPTATAIIESATAGEESTRARREWGQYLNVIELGGGIEQTLECLRNRDFRFRELVSPEALEVPADGLIPSFGVFLKGNFRAGNNQDPEESVLVVRIPYLGPERMSLLDAPESWSLSKFISQVAPAGLKDNPLEGDELPVHQAIFVVLNNAVILVSKSKEDNGARMVIPRQDRVGVFHVLVHMISETLRGGDRSILAALESQATLIEIQSLVPNDDSSREAARKLLGRITAIKALAAEQTAILEDLKDIFGRVVPDFKRPSVDSNKYTKNMLSVPVLSGLAERTRGQMSYVAATLETIIEERRQFSYKVAGIFETIQKAQASMTTNGQAQAQLEAQTQLAQEQQAEAKAQAQALQDEIEMQGKALSAFTVVNVLFLPLGFFTQASTVATSYFSPGSDNARNGVIGTSLRLFWAVTAPCTVFIAVLTAYLVLQSQYDLREFGRMFTDMLKLRGCKWPMTKADANSQKNYLRKLQKYRVSAVPANTGAAPQSGERYYLKGPEVKSGGELLLQVDTTPNPAGPIDEFWFDEKDGWLFHDKVDDYGYTHYAYVESPFVPTGDWKLPLSWKRSRIPVERKPYRFKGAIQVQGDSERFLSWGLCRKRGMGFLKPRWDTKDALNASDASYFTIGSGGQGSELSVKSQDSAEPTYSLKLTLVTRML